MKIEKQVVSIGLAKDLKDAGYEQAGIKWWYEGVKPGKTDKVEKWTIGLYGCNSITPGGTWMVIVAPTVAELGEALPKATSSFLTEQKAHCEWNHYHTWADTEANARAKMYLLLKKEGKI